MSKRREYGPCLLACWSKLFSQRNSFERKEGNRFRLRCIFRCRDSFLWYCINLLIATHFLWHLQIGRSCLHPLAVYMKHQASSAKTSCVSFWATDVLYACGDWGYILLFFSRLQHIKNSRHFQCTLTSFPRTFLYV